MSNKITNIKTGYTYRPSANMLPIVELGWVEIDVLDMLIYQEIVNMHNYNKVEKIYTDNKQWIWVSHAFIIRRLPYIGITSKSAIKKRIYKLIDREIIERKPPQAGDQKSYYALTKFHEYYTNEKTLVVNDLGCDENHRVPCDENHTVPCDENHTNDISNSNDISKKKDSTSTSAITNASEEATDHTLQIESEKDRVRTLVNNNMSKKTYVGEKRRDNTLKLLPEGMDIPGAVELFVNYIVVQKTDSSKSDQKILYSFDNYMDRLASDKSLQENGEQKATLPAASIGSKSNHLVNIYSKIVGKKLLEKELRCFNEMMAAGITDVVFAALCVSYQSLQDEEADATKMKEWFTKYGGNKIEKNFNWKDDIVAARKLLDKIK